MKKTCMEGPRGERDTYRDKSVWEEGKEKWERHLKKGRRNKQTSISEGGREGGRTGVRVQHGNITGMKLVLSNLA